MRILQICGKPMHPPNEVGSIAMYNLATGLIESNQIVHVLCMNTFKQYCDINTVPENF
jgi:hypothetical protein